MVKNTMIENNEFDRIEELVKEAVEIVKESRT
jgi:2-dehydro-3-deoxyphosphogluconate aldolase/(4S)-4-hydroxy-2-oxoglutarate aldolase